MSDKKKERVLHTRVPAVLEQELKRLATSLKVPVSNVVRTILEDAVDAVDSVGRVAEGEIRGVADKLRARRTGIRRNADGEQTEDVIDTTAEVEQTKAEPPLAGVIGYQALLMARAEACSLCGKQIEPGDTGYLGIRDGMGPRVIACEHCAPFRAKKEEQ